MSKEKETTVQETSQQVQPTAEEQELNKLLLEQTKAAQPGVLEAQESGLSLVNQLLTGGSLPGFLEQLSGGISPEAIGTQASGLSKKFGAGFQNLGISDSGVAFRETARGIADELLFPAEQFNINNLQNLLSAGLGGQMQVQSPIQGASGQVSSNLAGLRSTTGTGNAITTGMNPFLKSLQTGLGKNLAGFANPSTYFNPVSA